MSEFMIQDTSATELADLAREINGTTDKINGANIAGQIREGLKRHIDTSKITDWSYYCYNGARIETISNLDTSNGTSFSRMCYNASPDRGFGAELNCQRVNDMSYAFYGSTVRKLTLHFKEADAETGEYMMSTKLANAFRNATSLEELTVTGLVYANSDDLNIAYSPNLTVESLVSILNALRGNENISHTVYFGNTNINKLTEEQKQIAKDKNIILA